VDDVVKIGDKVQVKVIAIDDQDRIKLSRKALLKPAEGDGGNGEAGGGEDRPPREHRGDRGDRGGDRGERGGRGGGGGRGRDRGGDRDRG
jgi:polyribonucleotide nucleotidyltransferase